MTPTNTPTPLEIQNPYIKNNSTMPDRPIYADCPTPDEWVYVMAKSKTACDALAELREYRRNT